eukprot:Colp12_sorted_trinity150504_noHs@6716
MVGSPVGRLLCAATARGNSVLFAGAQGVLFALMFIFGNPLYVYPYLLVLLNFLATAVFGYMNTLVFLHGAHTPSAKEAEARTRVLGFSEQCGAFGGTLVTLVLVTTGVFAHA